MNAKITTPKAFIEETLDDILEGLHYRLSMETELTTAEVDKLIEEVLEEMGYIKTGDE